MTRVNVIISQGSKNWAHNLDDLLERWRERKSNNNLTIKKVEIEKNKTYDFVDYIRKLENEQLAVLLFDLFESRENIIKQIPQGKLKTPSEKEKKIQTIKDIKNVNNFIDYVLTEKNIREKKVKKYDHHYHIT